MALYRETLSIAGIRMAVESELEFRLADRCCFFRAEFYRPDVTFRLLAADSFAPNGMECLFQNDKRAMFRRENQLFHMRYDAERKGAVRWYAVQSDAEPQLIRVHIIARDTLQGVNPLIFVDLSGFMIQRDAMVLHSSLIQCEDRGIVFTAPSGTGKSTQADLWHKYRGADILNGDRSILRREADGYRAYGSPYAGSSSIYRNESTRLTAVVVLRQAKQNRLRRLNTREAYLSLLSEMSLSPISRDTVDLQSKWLLEMIGAVPVYLLECLPDEGAVALLYDEWRKNCD